MRKILAMSAAAALLTAPMAVPVAQAQSRTATKTYHGKTHHYRHRCSGGNGAVGTVAGGAGGALLGHAVLGGPVGIVAGGVGGALLGRHLDKVNTRHRKGC